MTFESGIRNPHRGKELLGQFPQLRSREPQRRSTSGFDCHNTSGSQIIWSIRLSPGDAHQLLARAN